MPENNCLPLPSTFLVCFYSLVAATLSLACEFFQSQRAVTRVFIPPPILLIFSFNIFVLALHPIATLAENNRARKLIRVLFSNFHGRRSRGRDLWQTLELNPIIFWYVIGEMPESLENIVESIYLEVTAPRHLPRTLRTNRRRSCILDVRNRGQLVMIWLRQYLKFHVLAHNFCISKSTVAEEIYHVVPILFVNYQNYIKWHSTR